MTEERTTDGDGYYDIIALVTPEGKPIDLHGARIEIVDSKAGIIRIIFARNCERIIKEEGDPIIICSFCQSPFRGLKCSNCGAPRTYNSLAGG